jgi:flagellar hook assembly protein FlgD
LRGDGPAEYFNLVWDGLDDSGTSLNNGVYLCRVSAVLEDGATLTEKKLVALVR